MKKQDAMKAMGVVKMWKFYFAYGANTNRRAMAGRCPTAKPYATGEALGHALVFRGVADIVEQAHSTVPGVLWKIEDEDEAALDRFEGFPQLYVKKAVMVRLSDDGGGTKIVSAMAYVMRDQRRKLMPPSFRYFSTISEGYRDFELPASKHRTVLVEAAERAKNEFEFRVEEMVREGCA